MSEITFDEFDQQVMALYEAKEYQQAFDLVEREYQHFSDHQVELAYLRLCMNGVTGRKTEALQIFQVALDQGYWFGPKWLQDDPDLAELQPLPEFQSMVEICRQHLTEAQAESRPELLVAAPKEQTGALPLVIALHGNNGNAANALPKWEQITTHGWLLAVPQSSQIVGPDAYVWDDREKGINEVREHLAKLSGDYNVDPARVVLGGFSMGGGQAIWMALHQSVRTRGFIALGPYLRPEELDALPALLETQKPVGLRGSILVGEEDHGCLACSRKAAELLNAHDIPCELEIRPGMGHAYSADFAEVVSKGLAFIEQA